MTKSVLLDEEQEILLNNARAKAITENPTIRATDKAVIHLALTKYLGEDKQ